MLNADWLLPISEPEWGRGWLFAVDGDSPGMFLPRVISDTPLLQRTITREALASVNMKRSRIH